MRKKISRFALGIFLIFTGLLMLSVCGFAADTYTTYYNLRQPDLDVEDEETPWGSKYNNNFTLIDAALRANYVMIQSTASELTAYKATVQASTASIYSALNSTGAALTAEIARATARENDIGVSTGSIYSALNSTGAALTAEISRATNREDAIAVSTGATTAALANYVLLAGTQSLSGTNTFLGESIFGVASDITISTGGRIGIGVAPHAVNRLTIAGAVTVNSPYSYYGSGAGLSGTAISLNIGGNAATATTVPSSGVDGSTYTAHILAVSTSSVQKSGDTMTGPLTLSGSSLTVNGNFNIQASTLVVKDGMVGIGFTPNGALSTSNPLTIYNTGTAYFATRNADTGITAADGFDMGVAATSMDVILLNREASHMRFFTSGSERLRIKSDGSVNFNSGVTATTMTLTGSAFSVGTSTFVVTGGNVGIGTSAPSNRLHINETTTTSALRVDQAASLNPAIYVTNPYGGIGSGLQFYNAASMNTDIGTKIYMSGTVNSYQMMALTSAWENSTSSSTYISLINRKNNIATEVMRITGNGNVGIGTTNPNTKLHLSSGVITLDGTGAGIALNGIYTEAKSSSTTGSNTTFNVAWSSTSVYEVTLATSTTFTFSGATTGQTMTLKLSQDAQGDRTVTWPTVDWGDYGTPIISTGAYKATLCSVTFMDGKYFGAPCLKGYTR